jgi:hypothetical protein
MNNESIQRLSDVLFDNIVLENDPIHVSGCALLLQNQSESDSVFSISESADGETYTAVLFATPTTANNATLDVVGLSSAVVAFRSDAKFVKLSVAVRNPEGIRVNVVQFEPRDQEHVSSY